MRKQVLLAIIAALCLHGTALGQGIQEYPAGGQAPLYITTGHDGRLWYTLSGSSAIGRLNAQGEAQPTIASNLGPSDIVTGPGGTMLWTTDLGLTQRSSGGALEHVVASDVLAVTVLPSGQILHGLWKDAPAFVWVETCNPFLNLGASGTPCPSATSVFPSPDHSVAITDLTTTPDGRLWIVLSEANVIRSRAPSGAFDILLDLNPGSFPHRITPGPDGAMWFTEFGANRIGRVTSAGVLTEFPLPRANVGPWDIVAGPDGALWFTETADAGNAIGRITTAGRITEYPLPSAQAGAWGITPGPDGKIWFTESFADKVGRLDPALATPIGGGPPGGRGTGPPDPAPDTTKPAFRGRVTISRKRFKRGSSITFRFTLSEPARLTLAFEQASKGRRRHGRCRAGARKGPACKLWRSTGPELTRRGTTGVNSIRFNGRFGRRPLAAGSYRAKLKAVDAAGNRSKTVTLGFKVIPK